MFDITSIDFCRSVVLTPNRRVANYLLTEYEKQAQSSNKTTWESPSIYTFGAWVKLLWEDLAFTLEDRPTLLSDFSNQLIWERALEQDSGLSGLLGKQSTAVQAMEADDLLTRWQITFDDIFQEETSAFLRWQKWVQALLAQQRWINASAMVEKLIEKIPLFQKNLPDQIYCVGFEQLDPQQKRFFSVLEASNIKHNWVRLNAAKPNITLQACLDPKEELYQAAAFAYFWHKKYPLEQIGVIIPDLSSRRQEVARIFSEYFTGSEFNLSNPIALSDYGFVSTAIHVLSLLKKVITFDELHEFLNFTYLGDAQEEWLDRTLLEQSLRETKRVRWEWKELIGWLNQKAMHNATTERFFCLYAFMSDIDFKTKKNTHTWLGEIERILDGVAFPGNHPFNEMERHLNTQWQLLLSEYVSLNRVLGKHTFFKALKIIKQLAVKIKFLPVNKTARVQVMGLLEGLHIPFDRLWVVGMHENAWPMPISPNPFIPLSLQKKHLMPRSCNSRELEIAKKYTKTFTEVVKKTVVFSYPQKIEEREVLPSSLVKNYYACQSKEWIKNKKDSEPKENTALEIVDEDNKYPIHADEKKIQGVQVLQDQALCPFKAFASHRLLAKAMEQPSQYLSSSERGQMIHEILANPSAKQHVDHVLNRWKRKRPYQFFSEFANIEKSRLEKLIENWEAIEKRQQTKVIAREYAYRTTLGELTLSLRVDRIEQLETGEQLIIDFKTGEVNLSACFSEPLLSPQMPLYCVTLSSRPQGIFFAKLHAKAIKLVGVYNNELTLDVGKPLENWEKVIKNWQKSLQALADDFAAGLFSIKPYDKKISCRYCDLSSLCRVQ